MNRRSPARHALPVLAFALFLSAVSGATIAAPDSAPARLTLDFNADWRFIKADPAGASAAAFDDGGWTVVSAPHTFNDTDTFDNWSTPGHRGEQIQWSGRTWYRKTITAPAAWAGKRVFIEFEAARQVAEVFLNGEKLGVSKTGFTPFGFDLTPHLKIGAKNVLAVMVDNRFAKDPIPPELGAQSATNTNTHPVLSELSKKFNEAIPEKLEDLQADQIPWNNPHWHPAHGGLYRNVRLIVADPLHLTLPLYSFLQTVGPYVYAADITAAAAQIHVELPVQNDRASTESVSARVELIDADGKRALSLAAPAQPLAPGAHSTLKLSGSLPQPRPWQPDYPHALPAWSARCSRTENPSTPPNSLSASARPNGMPTAALRERPPRKAPRLGPEADRRMARPWRRPTRLAACLHADADEGGRRQLCPLGPHAGRPGAGRGHGSARHRHPAARQRRRVRHRRCRLGAPPDRLPRRAGLFSQPPVDPHLGGRQPKALPRARRHHARADGPIRSARRPRLCAPPADEITAEYSDLAIGTEGGREIAALAVVEGEYNREESPRRVWDDASPPNFGYPGGQGPDLPTHFGAVRRERGGPVREKLGAENHSGGANWIFSDSTSGGRVATEVGPRERRGRRRRVCPRKPTTSAA
jgi:beta-galactosidase